MLSWALCPFVASKKKSKPCMLDKVCEKQKVGKNVTSRVVK